MPHGSHGPAVVRRRTGAAPVWPPVQLYEQVWARPMLAVAKEYEVSANYLARVCASLNVPWPPRGYWARVAAGQKPRRPALPPARSGDQLEWEKGAGLDVPLSRPARSKPKGAPEAEHSAAESPTYRTVIRSCLAYASSSRLTALSSMAAYAQRSGCWWTSSSPSDAPDGPGPHARDRRDRVRQTPSMEGLRQDSRVGLLAWRELPRYPLLWARRLGRRTSPRGFRCPPLGQCSIRRRFDSGCLEAELHNPSIGPDEPARLGTRERHGPVASEPGYAVPRVALVW